jgi:hypothetical protein
MILVSALSTDYISQPKAEIKAHHSLLSAFLVPQKHEPIGGESWNRKVGLCESDVCIYLVCVDTKPSWRIHILFC